MKNLKINFVDLALALIALASMVSGHGMMLEPPNRSSLWRYNPAAPINYDDNSLYCGGKNYQWDNMQGKCGVCGDPYDAPHPQDNENTGKYGRGIIAREYSSGQVIDIFVNLTMNHLGYMSFSLCVLDDPNWIEWGEGCFKPVQLGNWNWDLQVGPNDFQINTQVRLPDGLRCNRCVLRWHYETGNNWGDCGDGTSHLGCGPQENFINCADIAIY